MYTVEHSDLRIKIAKIGREAKLNYDATGKETGDTHSPLP